MSAGRAAPCVLLAEDDDELRSLLASVLRADGHAVVEAACGDELLTYLEAFAAAADDVPPPDLIISDVRMPGATGLEVLALLGLRGSHVPMILMTAFGDASTHAEAQRLGAALLLDKPFSLTSLRAAVLRLLAA